jgi:hypothetical protein
MSIMLTVEFDRELEQPYWISSWYSQVLPMYLMEVELGAGALPDCIGDLIRHFEINIDPLLNSCGHEFAREELPSDEIFARYQAQREAAWQPPQVLIDCTRGFVEKIESDPEVFSRLDITDKYFVGGGFIRELTDLIRIAEWAKEQGVQKLRMLVG